MSTTKTLSPNNPTQQPRDSARKINLIADADEIRHIFHKAVQRELQIHKHIGNRIATWRDGKVVIVPPEEIRVEGPVPPRCTRPATPDKEIGAPILAEKA